MNTKNNGSATTQDRLGAIKDKARDIVDQGHEKVDHLKSRVIDVKDQAVSRGNVLVDRVTEYIRANPLKSVGIAFGVGYVGMRLFRR